MDNKQIGRHELDDCLTQEPDRSEYEDWSDYYDELDAALAEEDNDRVDQDDWIYEQENYDPEEPYPLYTPFQCWVEDWAAIWRQIVCQFWEPCPDDQCHTPYRILWFTVGKHDGCIPF